MLLKSFKFSRAQDVLQICNFDPTLNPVSRMNDFEIEKTTDCNKEIYPLGYPNIQKSGPFLVLFLNQK